MDQAEGIDVPAAATRLGALYGGAADAAADLLAAFGEHLGRALHFTRAAALVTEADGRDSATQRANWHLRSALGQLRKQSARTDDRAARAALAELARLARFAVTRQH